MPRIDVKFQRKHEEIMQLAKDMNPEENAMNEELIEKALKQIFEEFVRRGTLGEISPASSSGIASAGSSPAVQELRTAAQAPPRGVAFGPHAPSSTPQFGHATPFGAAGPAGPAPTPVGSNAAWVPSHVAKRVQAVHEAVAAKLATHDAVAASTRAPAAASAAAKGEAKAKAKKEGRKVGMEQTVEHIHIYEAVSPGLSPAPSGTASPSQRSGSPAPAAPGLTRPEDAVAQHMQDISMEPAASPRSDSSQD